MGQGRRKRSEANLYHVMQRGNSRQLLFEDDADRWKYIEITNAAVSRSGVSILAWCLMDNHTHLLVHGELEQLSTFMEHLGGCYSRYFRKRHDRVGHLYQGRFKSKPVADEAHLTTLVRYIHRNPVEEGISSTCSYPWSSYLDLAGTRQEPPIELSDEVLSLFKSKASFCQFNEKPDEEKDGIPRKTKPARKTGARPPKMSDSDAKCELQRAIASRGYEALPHDDRYARNEILRELKDLGCSVRQIERLTGVGRNIIQRA